VKTKRFLGQDYWAKPLPSFGDIKGKLLIIGLAPAAHGGNRTGRLFTGDSSGDWVARALYETGFANISKSESKNDGLLLKDVFISTAVRCAPPNNTPTSLEIFNCSQYLLSELIILDPTIKSCPYTYHPSRQNTNTGKLTWQIWISIFRTAKFIIYK
jgi:uracil-DNA glycosylase